jgi:single-strand DNA-binding protein
MANVNKVILLGNLTRDPEVKHTQKGLAVADFGLAVNRTFTTDSGEKREEATFIDITVWGKTAELARQYLTKGRQVYIEGRLQFDSWEDKQTGQKRSKLRVVGETIQFLGSRQDGQPARAQAGSSPTSFRAGNAATSPATALAPLDGDDYPF